MSRIFLANHSSNHLRLALFKAVIMTTTRTMTMTMTMTTTTTSMSSKQARFKAVHWDMTSGAGKNHDRTADQRDGSHGNDALPNARRFLAGKLLAQLRMSQFLAHEGHLADSNESLPPPPPTRQQFAICTLFCTTPTLFRELW